MEKENKIFLVAGPFQIGKTKLIKYFGRDGKALGVFPQTNFEKRFRITAHSRSFTYEFEDDYITFIDTPGHSDFITETLTLLNLLNNVILVINLEENIEPMHFDMLNALSGKNIYLFFNKADLSFRNGMRKKQIDEVIQVVQKYLIINENIFICSATEEWVYNINSIYCKSSELLYIYTFVKTRETFAIKKFGKTNCFLFQVKRHLIFRKKEKSYFYIFKKYYVQGKLFNLVFSDCVIEVNECYNGFFIKSIIVGDSDSKKSLVNVPSFIEFNKEVKSDAFLVGGYDTFPIPVFLIFKVSFSNVHLLPELIKFSSTYLHIFFEDEILFSASELLLDSFFSDFKEITYKEVIIKFKGLKEVRNITNEKKERKVEYTKINHFTFEIEPSKRPYAARVSIANNHSLYSKAFKLEYPTLIKIKETFDFVFAGLEVYNNDFVVFFDISIIRAMVDFKYFHKIHDDIKEAMVDELNIYTNKQASVFLVKIMYEDYVHDVIFSTFKFVRYFKILKSKYCTLYTTVRNEDIMGFDKFLAELTHGKAFCVKKFYGFV